MTIHQKKILVTDGGSVNSLAIVRHLGVLGYSIVVIAYNKMALSAWSRYCYQSHLLPHPKTDGQGFVEGLINIVKSEKIEFLMPVGFYSHKAIIEHQGRFDELVMTYLPRLDSFKLATSKINTAELAASKGVSVPKTILPLSMQALDQAQSLRFPLVIKSTKEIGGRMVEYASNQTELIDKFHKLITQYKLVEQDYPLVQEYIEGVGVGYFALYHNGQCVADFMHERVREFPVSGGRSVCAKSILDPQLRSAGRAVLEALHWNGCAMVEFKRTADNQYYLLEVNPKLWGSLELAICAGVNFPELMIQCAFGLNLNNLPTYQKNVYFQWLLNGEVYHFFNRPRSIFSIFKTMLHSYKDFWWSDLKPNLLQMLLIPLDFYKAIKGKTGA